MIQRYIVPPNLTKSLTKYRVVDSQLLVQLSELDTTIQSWMSFSKPNNVVAALVCERRHLYTVPP